MKEAMVKFENAMNDVMDEVKSELGRVMFDENMDERGIKLLMKSFTLVDASMNVMKAQADMMVEMNEKLDRLMKKQNKERSQ